MSKLLQIACAVLLTICVTKNMFAQTSSFGNYEVYNAKPDYRSIGYLNITINMPEYLGKIQIQQTGISYQKRYTIADMAKVKITDNFRFKFFMQGTFRIGFAIGESNNDSIKYFWPNKKSLKYYTGLVDFFTYGIVPEFTFVLGNGYAITGQLGIDLINVGATASAMDKGNIDDAIIQANFIPIVFRPSLFIDFGKMGFGIGFYMNSSNILDYFYGSRKIFSDKDIGIVTNSRRYERYAVELLFVF
jgi:hypothetical protein